MTTDKVMPVNQEASGADPGQRRPDVRERAQGTSCHLADKAQGALLLAVPR